MDRDGAAAALRAPAAAPRSRGTGAARGAVALRRHPREGARSRSSRRCGATSTSSATSRATSSCAKANTAIPPTSSSTGRRRSCSPATPRASRGRRSAGAPTSPPPRCRARAPRRPVHRARLGRPVRHRHALRPSRRRRAAATRPWGPGEIFGEIGALSRYAVSATVRAAHAAAPACRSACPGCACSWPRRRTSRRAWRSATATRILSRQLRKVPLFARLDDSFLEDVKRQAELLSFEPGQVIVRGGRGRGCLPPRASAAT